MRFLVDANLPPALARALCQAGWEAVHVCDIGMAEASDRRIWDHALQGEAVLLTKDEDFADRSLREQAAPIIVWIRFGNCRKAEVVEPFLKAIPQLVSAIEAGLRLIELVK